MMMSVKDKETDTFQSHQQDSNKMQIGKSFIIYFLFIQVTLIHWLNLQILLFLNESKCVKK